MRKDAGFTVAELIIVMVIAGVLLAVAVPNYITYMSGYRLKGALSTLQGDLYKAKMLAIKRGVEYRVAIAPAGYQVQRGNLNLNSTSWTTEFARNFAEDYEGVTANTVNPVFSPRGTAATTTITLSQGSKSNTISIFVAGKIKVN